MRTKATVVEEIKPCCENNLLWMPEVTLLSIKFDTWSKGHHLMVLKEQNLPYSGSNTTEFQILG